MKYRTGLGYMPPAHPVLSDPDGCMPCLRAEGDHNAPSFSSVGDDDFWYAEHRAWYLETGDSLQLERALRHVRR